MTGETLRIYGENFDEAYRLMLAEGARRILRVGHATAEKWVEDRKQTDGVDYRAGASDLSVEDGGGSLRLRFVVVLLPEGVEVDTSIEAWKGTEKGYPTLVVTMVVDVIPDLENLTALVAGKPMGFRLPGKCHAGEPTAEQARILASDDTSDEDYVRVLSEVKSIEPVVPPEEPIPSETPDFPLPGVMGA